MTIRRETSDSSVSRRSFIAGASVATAATVLQAKTVFGYQANSKVSIGLIGCGGRGTWIANLFKEHGGYELAAVADYFEDRVKACGDKFGVDGANRFSGLKGYERMLEKKVDAIVIESPPYFHPEQAAAGVAAGKHVYVAKPVAVDVPGCKSIEQSGVDASKAGLCFLVDFQTRADQYYMEAIRRVHEGAIGKFAFGESTYHAGIPWERQKEAALEAATNPEAKLAAWGVDQVLSGDIITEQNIHTIDVASWIMNAAPVCAYGTGGRMVRDYGNCWDTFSITFVYPDNVGIAFSSRQFNGHGSQPDGIRNRMFGVDGVLETAYGGDTLIRGTNFYRGGKSPAIYKEGAVTNIATFHKSIQEGDTKNPTVAPSVRSNLVTILGRTAAYKGEVVRWDDLLKCDEKLDPKLEGLKS
ncbi:MAG: Gfo/Idh/MocA family oxidoreductase [Planctomycetaceae bacterium]|nr:Gfo/Idh/MocA family oxidoreductase [Planctomycetaceae bacterium]